MRRSFFIRCFLYAKFYFAVTIRLIRSFEHRNIRFLVIKGLRSHQNVGELKRTISESKDNDYDYAMHLWLL